MARFIYIITPPEDLQQLYIDELYTFLEAIAPPDTEIDIRPLSLPLSDEASILLYDLTRSGESSVPSLQPRLRKQDKTFLFKDGISEIWRRGIPEGLEGMVYHDPHACRAQKRFLAIDRERHILLAADFLRPYLSRNQ